MSAIPKHRYLVRRKKLLSALKKQKLPTLLVSNPVNVHYLTGFTGDSSFLVFDKDICILLSDSRFTTQIEQECPDVDLSLRSLNESLEKALGRILKKSKIGAIGFESGDVSFAQYSAIKDSINSTELVDTNGVVEQLRLIKDADEIAQTRLAVHQAERGFAVARASIEGGMTELALRNLLEGAMRQFGAETAAFETIVASGANAAMAHARPGDALIGDSDFTLIDWGACSTSGYHSDLTRIIPTSKISAKLDKVYHVVLEAQQAAIREIRPGQTGSQIDKIARSFIESAGFGKRFGHGLGHGVGLQIHESPRLSLSSQDVLQAGMIVTVEPGIYLPGWGGVRIEDDVLVTRDGCEVLSSVTHNLEEMAMPV